MTAIYVMFTFMFLWQLAVFIGLIVKSIRAKHFDAFAWSVLASVFLLGMIWYLLSQLGL